MYFISGTLDVQRVTVEGNEAQYGGGLYTYAVSGTISDSLFTDNVASVSGGGLLVSTAAEITLTGVTVSGNSATTWAGGVYFYDIGGAQSQMINCTVTDNQAGFAGGVFQNGSASVRLDNTIVADNTVTSSYRDMYGTFDADSSNNLVGDGTGMSGITDDVRGNQVGTYASPIDPLLGSLAHNGGLTKTHMPQSNSPALDAGSGLLNDAYYDGRGEGFIRSVGTAIDIGAVEYNPHDLVVDELTNPANGLTLAEAIATANSRPGHDTITFSGGLDLSSAVDITLSSELSVTGDLTILGPGADQLAISANDGSRVFNLGAGTTVRLVGLALRDGSATGAGGAVYSAADRLVVERCAIVDSAATSDGGGISSGRRRDGAERHQRRSGRQPGRHGRLAHRCPVRSAGGQRRSHANPRPACR